MTRVKKGECTPRQFAYAQRIFGGKGRTRKEIAMDVGYSSGLSNNPGGKIERTQGFHVAMMKLAVDSNNLALAAMEEFKLRGFSDFSNKDLVGALNAIGSAWSRFNDQGRSREEKPNSNRLRTVVLQHIENQTMNSGPINEVPPVAPVENTEVNNDF